jgi:hypothetical protein
MGNFDFKSNSKILVNTQNYTVIGAIYYSNTKDQSIWVEYCIHNDSTNETKYLSVDQDNHEYALYTMENNRSDFSDSALTQKGYHQVDQGNARVTDFWGKSDVEVGDRVQYCEYEDSTGQKIMAIERWDDETEYSSGSYVDQTEIQLINQGYNTSQWRNSNAHYDSGETYNNSSSGLLDMKKLFAILTILVIVGSLVATSVASLFQSKKIANYLSKSPSYSYATSITSNQRKSEKADVYTTSLSIDLAVKDIIDMLHGNLLSVQQNTEDPTDNSVAILTKKEYCLVYKNTEDITTVQISSRLYTYTSDSTPYHSSNYTGRYYRRYYYSNAYSSDNRSYKKYNSSYSIYNDSRVNTNDNDPYNIYSSSVRQSSRSSRSSLGGGTSAGK